MLNAFLILIACQFTGELLEKMLHLPVPGPVIGMFLLAAALIFADGKGEHRRGGPRGALERLSRTLISLMGLYFVPAGVGVITQAHLLRREWLPILCAVVGSTLLSIAVTGLAMRLTLGSVRTSIGEDQDSPVRA
jgi:holin-like protein